MKAYRVLAITNMWPMDGEYRGQFVKDAIDALRRAGTTVDVEVIVQGRGRADYVAAIPRIRSRITTGRYDIVHVHFGMTAPASLFPAKIPRVISLYGSDINVRWKRWFTRLGSVGSEARIYVSARLRDTARDPSGHVIPNGVDLTSFKPMDREAARRELGLQPTSPIVLFGGSPERRVKGYDIFERVLRELEIRGLKVRPLILSAPHQSAEHVALKYAAADVLLFTSQRGSEGSPTVVKEAVVMGLPVVSVDVGDVAEVLASVDPSRVVSFPAEGDGGRGRGLIAQLADGVQEVLATSARSDGPAMAHRLSLDAAAVETLRVYGEVTRS